MNFLREGKINWKYILIVLILAVIVSGGILVWQYRWIPEKKCICPKIYRPVCGINGVTYDNNCFAECYGVKIVYEGECKPEEQVTITTDKTEYEQGEIIKIVLRNNLNRSIVYEDLGDITCAGTSFSLGKKENEEYKNFYPLGTEKCVEPIIKLESNSEKIYTFNLLTLEKRNWGDIYNTELSGVFKLQFNYFFKEIEHEELGEAVYSNEFTIKEKKEAVNWKIYRNEKHRFSFEYPEKIDLGKGFTQIVVEENLKPIDAVFVVFIEKPFTIGFKVLEKPKNFSNLEEYVRTLTEEINKIEGAAPIYAEFNEFVIDDIKGFAIKTTAADVLGNTSIEIYFEKMDQLFVIRYSYSKTLLREQDPLESSKYNTIQKIISTFRFLE